MFCIDQMLSRVQYTRSHKTAAVPRQLLASAVQWCPPPAGFVKCNLDAAFYKEQQCVGVGVQYGIIMWDMRFTSSSVMDGIYGIT
jgi:hypothetical protein